MIREAVYKLTENCPCDCTFCDSRAKYLSILKKKTLPFETWVQITDKLLESGLEVVVVSGGEPLLEKDTAMKLIDYLHENRVFVVLNTSGVLFKNDNEMLSELTNHFPDLLVFSIDSVHPERHDGNRRIEGLFYSIEKSIQFMKKQGDYPIAIRTVITRNNYRELPDIIDYFSSLKVDCVKLTNIENDTEKQFHLRKEELEEFDKEIRPRIIKTLQKAQFEDEALLEDNIKKIEGLLSPRNPDFASIAEGIFSPKLSGKTPCDLNGRFFAIQSNGDVLPCCEAEHHYIPLLGNLLFQSVEEIENSEQYLNFKTTRPRYCRTCTQRHNLQLDFRKRIQKVDRR